MADIRIKDLTTEAPASVTSDFLPIDGNTGTRKLSAYSPSFGGNATVGGTLTVNSSVQSSAVFAANNTTLLLRPGGAAVTTGQLSIDTSGNANAEGIIGTSASSMRVTNTNGGFLIYKDATPTGAARFTYNTAAANTISFGVYDGASWTDPFRVTTTQALVTTTTASTSTSSGALVVSGGVGVAKRIFTGEGLDTAGDNATHISFVRNGTVSIGPDSAATPALVVSTAIKTSAPSGGTAANWKLGTVATVSPTSPNRTIEVEIGGTTYYLHAKTTNN